MAFCAVVSDSRGGFHKHTLYTPKVASLLLSVQGNGSSMRSSGTDLVDTGSEVLCVLQGCGEMLKLQRAVQLYGLLIHV